MLASEAMLLAESAMATPNVLEILFIWSKIHVKLAIKYYIDTPKVH